MAVLIMEVIGHEWQIKRNKNTLGYGCATHSSHLVHEGKAFLCTGTEQ